MKNLRILAAATLFALTSIAMLAGCGDTNDNPGAHPDDGKVCKGHKDCSDGTICVEWVPDDPAKPKGEGKGKCRVDCAKNGQKDQATCDSKAKGKTCIAHDAKWACSPKAGGPGQQEPECSATKPTCKDTTKVCDTAAGKCVKPCEDNNGVCKTGLQTCDAQTKLCQDVELHSVVIIDESTGDVACGTNVKDKGSDIVAVEVVASDDSKIAFAGVREARNGVDSDTGTQATDGHYDQDQPDGHAPKPDSKNCILDNLGNNKSKFSSIGCGGALSLTVGSTKSFKMGDKIKVYEYDGQVCAKDPSTAGANEDKYKVYVCAKEQVLLADVAVDCILISGTEPLSGFSETTIK